nr:unnamed protein product [Callosobruchus chinensis]
MLVVEVEGIIKILALRSNRKNFALLIKKSLKFWELETHHEEDLISSCEASNKFNYIIFAVTAAAVGYDGILLSCIVMLEVQFKLLNNKLGTLFVGRKHQTIDVDEDIRKCLDHHNYLLKFVDHSNKTYSLTLLVYLGNVILAMCVEFYTVSKQISPGITSKALLYIATILFQFFFFYCMPGQLLANESEITPNVVFSNNWEDISSPSVKCAIKLIIQRCQKPVSVLAGGIFPINLGSGLAEYSSETVCDIEIVESVKELNTVY